MNGKFTHYLITRFNVPVKNWTHDKLGNHVGHDSWMNHRLQLFSRYCVPTVLHQSRQEFTWLVYIDPNTKPENQEEIKKALQEVPHAKLRMAPNMEGLLNDLRQMISECTTEYIITSRLDNDDGLGKEYIHDIQEAFQTQHRCLINFDHGVVYDIHKKVLTELRQARVNHFTSLIERRSANQDNLTVLGFPHTHPPEDCMVLNLSTPYAWLKIIHERNLVSRTKGRPVSIGKVVPHFPIDKKDFPISISNTLRYYVEKIIHRIINTISGKS